MARGNIFEKLSDKRKEEQEGLEAKLSGEVALSDRERVLKGRARKHRNATTLTITIDAEAKEKLKLHAFNEHLSVSDLIHRWIQTLPDV